MTFKTNLAVPIPYLIQKNFDFNSLDEFGWSLNHYAVAFNNIERISEILYCNINFNILSSNNKILKDAMTFYGKEGNNHNYVSLEIPFTSKGYTPIHLNIYLLSYYKNKIPLHIEYKNLCSLQKEIFNQFLTINKECLFWTDKDGLSVSDYCFLTLNFDLLKEIQIFDPEFSSLISINENTAKTICEIEIKKIKASQNLFSPEHIKFLDDLVFFFKSKEIRNSLEDRLLSKVIVKNDIIKI